MSLALITYQAGKLFPLACSPTGGWRCLTAPSVAAWACTLCLRRCIWPPLAFDANLQAKQAQARCGLSVIDLRTRDAVHWLRISGVIEELYDVTVLPGVRRAMAVGVHTDQIRRVFSMPPENSTATGLPAVEIQDCRLTIRAVGAKLKERRDMNIPRQFQQKVGLSGRHSILVLTLAGVAMPAAATAEWEQVQKLFAADGAAGDDFGSSVVLSEDRAMIGAPYNEYGVTNTGAAYIFSHGEFTVAIDIKPGNPRNPVNPRASGKTQVVLLSTSTASGEALDFDALQVDPASVRYGVGDVDRDGHADLLLFFKTREIGIVCGDTEASVTGDTFAGQAITGTDAVKTVGCKTHGPKT